MTSSGLPFASPCPEALRHGPADAVGRCPWCGRKYADATRRPTPRRMEMSGLSDAYGEFYDPDFGALGPAEVERRYLMGLYS